MVNGETYHVKITRRLSHLNYISKLKIFIDPIVSYDLLLDTLFI